MEEKREHRRPVGMTKKTQANAIRSLGYKLTNVSPTTYRIEVPSFGREMFERGQRYLSYHLVKFLDFTIFYWPLFTDDPDEGIVMYLLGNHIEISPDMYAKNTPKFPIYVDGAIKFVGNTSRGIRMEIRHPDVTSPYAVYSSIDVNVDPVTRRPKSIPDWWKQRHTPTVNDARQLQGVASPTVKPKHGVYGKDREIHYSEIDANQHTNFSSYMRLCLDTFYEIVEKDKTAESFRIFLSGQVKEMSFAYKGDSKLGDILRIEFWRDATASDTFYFEIRNGPKTIVTAVYTFYRSLVDSNL